MEWPSIKAKCRWVFHLWSIWEFIKVSFFSTLTPFWRFPLVDAVRKCIHLMFRLGVVSQEDESGRMTPTNQLEVKVEKVQNPAIVPWLVLVKTTKMTNCIQRWSRWWILRKTFVSFTGNLGEMLQFDYITLFAALAKKYEVKRILIRSPGPLLCQRFNPRVRWGETSEWHLIDLYLPLFLRGGCRLVSYFHQRVMSDEMWSEWSYFNALIEPFTILLQFKLIWWN